MKHRTALYFASLQSIAYRQTNLASNQSWDDILSGQPLFTTDNKDGRVTSLDATELSGSPGAFIVPNSAGTGFDSPAQQPRGSRKERP